MDQFDLQKMQNSENGNYAQSVDNAQTIMYGAYDIAGSKKGPNGEVIVKFRGKHDNFTFTFKGFNFNTSKGKEGVSQLSHMFNAPVRP